MNLKSKSSTSGPYRRGRQINKFRLEAFLGSGAFSDVWRCYDVIEQRMVALKISHSTKSNSEEEKELLREIRLGAHLHHPNILQIRSAYKENDRYLMVSQLAKESLADRMTRRMTVRRALHYFEQLLRGLSYAHSERVVHRDIKPSNLLLFPDDRLRIGDFGLARRTARNHFTGTGSGSLPYISPEQAHGQPCFASDVFSAGLIGYELLAGVLPEFPFEWPFDEYDALNERFPRELLSFFKKSCQPDHRKRYVDAQAAYEAWKRVARAVDKAQKPKVQARKKRSAKSLGRWRAIRFRECEQAFGRELYLKYQCPECEGPISEHMKACPWCGEREIEFGEGTEYPSYCERCTRGLREEWRYCGWCWGPAYRGESGGVKRFERYSSECLSCAKPLVEGMHYCPWCHQKQQPHADIDSLPDQCHHCESSVVRALWEHCPWCAERLT